MYSLQKGKRKYIFLENMKVYNINLGNGFLLNSHSNSFTIDGITVSKIYIYDINLSGPIVSKMISKKFDKLIKNIMNLLIDSDDDGDEVFELALNQIEKFRQEIKNKYRVFLEQQELNYMAKKLKRLQNEVRKELGEKQYNLVNSNNYGGKSR